MPTNKILILLSLIYSSIKLIAGVPTVDKNLFNTYKSASDFVQQISNKGIDTSEPFSVNLVASDFGLTVFDHSLGGFIANVDQPLLKLVEVQQYNENAIVARIDTSQAIKVTMLPGVKANFPVVIPAGSRDIEPNNEDPFGPQDQLLIEALTGPATTGFETIYTEELPVNPLGFGSYFKGTSYLRGRVSDLNWDVKIDFGGVAGAGEGLENNGKSFVEAGFTGRLPNIQYKLAWYSLDFPYIPMAWETPLLRDPGKVTHKNYISLNKGSNQNIKLDISGLTALTEGWETGLKLLVASGKIKYPQTSAAAFQAREFVLLFDRSRDIWGFRGAFSMPAFNDPSQPGLGFKGELTFQADPFIINSLGFGVSDIQIPIPGTGNTVYWQEIFGGVYDVAITPWYLKADVLFSHGKDKINLGLKKDYLFSASGSAQFKSDGFWEVILKAMALGYPISEAYITRDPRQAKFVMGFSDFPQPPLFLTDGNIGTTHGNFSASGTTRIGVPKSVPVIGGATFAGMDYGVKKSGSVWDVYSQFNYQITPEIPPVCSPVKITTHVSEKTVRWDGCCSRAPWWLGGGCIGCLRVSWNHFVPKFEWKTVCTDPVPATKGSFRVGIKGGEWYTKSASGNRKDLDNFFEKMYLANYPEWELPFYFSEKNKNGDLAYYNYNWDRLFKIYSEKAYAEPATRFMPSSITSTSTSSFKTREFLEGNLEYSFDIMPNDFEVVILRVNYEEVLEEAKDILLTLPDDSDLIGVEDNRPFGYGLDTQTISCTHIPENKEIFFTILEPNEGEYSLKIANFNTLGRHTVELYKQNDIPNFSYGEGNMATNRDATISKTQIDFTIGSIEDKDTEAQNIFVTFFLDTNKNNYDGIKLGTMSVEELKQNETVRFETNQLGINSGFYYGYIEIDDQRNAPIKRYLDGQLFVQDDDAPEPVEEINVIPTQSGFEIAFQPATDDQGLFNYEVVIMDEGDEDKSGKTTTLYDNKYRTVIKGLERNKPYLVSVVTVDTTTGLRSYPKAIRRVIPGFQSTRSLYVMSKNKASATVGYNYHYPIHVIDGDGIHDSDSATGVPQRMKFEILGDTRGASISDNGLFSWLPDNSHVGEQTFEIKITQLMSEGENNNLDDGYQSHKFNVLVNPEHNLSSLDEHGLIFISTPVYKVPRGGDYVYNSIVNFPENSPLTLELIEGPEGMEIGDDGTSVIWNNVQQNYGSFVEIGIYNEDYSSLLCSQRWYLDVVANNLDTTNEPLMQGIKVFNNNYGPSDIKFNWSAAQGDYYLQINDDATGEWTNLNDQLYSGGLNVVTGLQFQEMPSSQLFFRFLKKE